MKILSWNINGIRASKRSLKDVLDSLNADVICLQETKITRDMLDEPSAIVDGYNAYFSFSRKRSGYSGTVNFCRDNVTPVAAEEGLSGQLVTKSEGSVGCLGNLSEFESDELMSLDAEGRTVITEHEIELENGNRKMLVIINVYVPRACVQDERWSFKLRFLALLQSRAESLLRNGRKKDLCTLKELCNKLNLLKECEECQGCFLHVIVLGDINTTHKRIDICDPSTQEYLQPESRQWIDQFLRPEDRDPELTPIEDKTSYKGILSDTEGAHFIDTFRFFHPDMTDAYTNWSTVTSARQTNYGKRLDYIFVDVGLQDYLVDCQIMPDFEGSDHCPVVLEIRCKSVPAKMCPPLCTKLMPEFQGKQQKLFSFFSKSSGAKPVTGLNEVIRVSQSKDSVEINLTERLESLEKLKVMSSQSSVDLSTTLPELESAEDHNQQHSPKGSLKRTASRNPSDFSLKKRKSVKKGSSKLTNSANKQASLMNFFQKPPSSLVTDSCIKHPKDATSKYWQKHEEGNSHTVHNVKTSPSDHSLDVTESCLPAMPSPVASVSDSSKEGDHSNSEDTRLLPKPVILLSQEKSSDKKASEHEEESAVDNHTEGSGSEIKSTSSSLWKGLLSGPPPPPLCKGHREPCVLRTVKKAGPNKGKQFYVCARPEGHSTNKEARCDTFQWVSYSSSGKKTQGDIKKKKR